MKIISVKLFRVDLPLRAPFQHSSSGHVTHLQEVVARIESDDGAVGWGEVRGNCTYVTGDTPDRIVAAATYLAPLLLGQSLDEIPCLAEKLERAIVGNSASRAVLDIALHDALARARGVPVTDLLGGVRRRDLPTDVCVAFCPPDEAARQAQAAVREGYAVVKVRVGLPSKEDDARLSAIRAAIDAEPSGERVELAADANGAFAPKDAIRAIRRWEKHRLVYVEQPVPPDDLEGLRLVRQNVAVPIMADEAAISPRAVLRLVESEAADMLHFKLIKAGGFVPLRRMEGIAEAAGLPYMIGQMDEGILATAAAVHAGAASLAKFFEVGCYQGVASQPFAGLECRQGCLVVPKGRGLGVEVDESALTCVGAFA